MFVFLQFSKVIPVCKVSREEKKLKIQVQLMYFSLFCHVAQYMIKDALVSLCRSAGLLQKDVG